jgi:nitroreductase
MTADPAINQLVDLASRSPSGHNTQPWTVVRTEGQRLVLRSEPGRWLKMVDPTNRELLLSFGALIETIRQAGPALGYRIDLEVLADRPEASDIAHVDLSPAPVATSNASSLIRSRASTRTPFLPVELDSKDVDHILAVDRSALHFVPRQSQHGRWIAEATGEAFAHQTWDDAKQAELAGWLRFSRREVRTRGDGLTPEALGLAPLGRAIWYATFTRKQALRAAFRRSSVKVTQRQVQGCAGFLLVTSADRSVRALLDAGATYLRALLRATDLRVAHHTMSYALEEEPWRDQIDSALQFERPIQFVVRIGRAKRLARPSIRRTATSLFDDRVAPS